MRSWVAVMAILLVGCGKSTGDSGGADPFALCDIRDGGHLVSALDVTRTEEAATIEGDRVSVTLKVSATVPCLRGGARANVSATRGTIDNAAVGEAAKVRLSPVERLESGPLEGFAVLTAPGGSTEHVLIQLDAYSKIVSIDVPSVDAGVPDGGN